MATAGVFEGGQRVAGVCFESGQAGCQVGLAVAAVLCDHQAPTQGVTRTDRIGGAEGEAIGLQRERDLIRVAGGLGGIDLDRSRRPSPHRRNGERQCEERAALVNACVSCPRASLARCHSTDRSGWPMSWYAVPSKPCMPYGTSSLPLPITTVSPPSL